MSLYQEPVSLREPLLETLEDKRKNLFKNIQQTGFITPNHRQQLNELSDLYLQKYQRLESAPLGESDSVCRDEMVVKWVADLLVLLAENKIGYHCHKVLDFPVQTTADGDLYSDKSEKRWG